MQNNQRVRSRTEKRLDKLFRKLYTDVDCQTTYKVGEVCDMIKDCYSFQGSDAEKGNKILQLTERRGVLYWTI